MKYLRNGIYVDFESLLNVNLNVWSKDCKFNIMDNIWNELKCMSFD